MELVLRYRGQLPPTNDRKKHIPLKHQMRRAFHSQLAYQWQQHPYLREELKRLKAKVFSEAFYYDDAFGFQFVPLVINKPYLSLVCDLSIRFATRDFAGDIVNCGDLDNRIKTLLDSLRMPNPKSLQELPSGATPQANEAPFFCLLEDDHLITKLCVTSEKNLEAPLPHERESDVLLTIDAVIKTNPYKHPTGAWGAGGGSPF